MVRQQENREGEHPRMNKITIKDIRLAGHCCLGAKGWFKDHGFDFRKFLKDGIEEEVFLGTGCAHAKQVVDAKRKRENG